MGPSLSTKEMAVVVRKSGTEVLNVALHGDTPPCKNACLHFTDYFDVGGYRYTALGLANVVGRNFRNGTLGEALDWLTAARLDPPALPVSNTERES